MKTGADGRSIVKLTARGLGIPMPVPVGETYFDQSPIVRVQLVAYDDQTVTCWKSDFSPAGTAQNNPGRFVAEWP